jgi:hypothetical protein
MRSSVPLTAGSGRIRSAMAALCAMAALAIIATVAPAAAHAEFTLHACEGSAITGEGSSLQKTAQVSFWDTGEVFDSPLFGCGSSAPQVTYASKSSGCGLDAVGAGTSIVEKSCSFPSGEGEKPGYRSPVDSFGASDFAPDPEQEQHINAGLTGEGTPGSGKIHVIPVASAAITVVVHFPNHCALQDPEQEIAGVKGNGNTSTGGINDPGGKDGTGDKFSNQTLRVHITAQKLEEIWQGSVKTWGEVIPAADFLAPAVNGVSETQTNCANTPIVRIVRFDTSGTTYNFKAYLSLLPFTSGGGPSLWTSSTSAVGRENRVWPVASRQEEPPAVNGANECASEICKSSAEGGGALANAVKATNGSIGYLDLATARKEGFDVTPNAKKPGEAEFEQEEEFPVTSGKFIIKNEDDRTYWIPLQTISPEKGDEVGANYAEPTTEPTAHFNIVHPAPNGANCGGADYRGIPTTPESDPTLGDWSTAIATGGKTATAYPVCALTYDLAFDDDATVYGNTSTEEAKARTVKDYLTAIVSNGGGLKAFDYGILPPEIVRDAQTGVAAIGWNKTAGAGGGTKEEPVKAPPTTTTTTTTTPTIPPAVTIPSNAFSIASGKVKGKDIVLSLVLPDAGTLQIKATGGGVTVSNVTASVSGGQGTAILPISGAALKKLAKSKTKKLSVTITVTFTPTGGTAATQKKTLTITQASVAGKPKKKKGKKG